LKTCLTRGLTAVRPFFVLVGALGLASLPAAMQLPEPPSTAPPSLKTIPVELPSNLFDAVADLDAAKRLGKALFWDMQLGSDGMACASCHFHAGADSRVKNQINPGPMDAFGTFFSGSGGANYTPKSCDFPFHRLADPVDNDSAVVHDTDDRMSSAGVFRREFVSVTPGVGADTGDIVHDDIHFDVNGVHTRRVEPRNTPTTINSIFLHRIFFDGRANNFFNGLNPFGETDPDAKVLVKSGPNPDDPVNLERMLFDHAATASQAVGPPGSPFEMSFDHRTWPNIGHKLVVAKPLAGQQVANDDSLLGVLDRAPDATDSLPGLDQTLTYSDLIKLAFHEKFWGSNQVFDAPNNFTQMEMNFSLFFGLSILCYESTLVSDDSRYDQYMDGGGEGGTNSDILTQEEKDGLDTFINQGACIACHAGAEFAGGANSLIAIEGPIERMLMADGEAEGNLQLITYPPPPDEELTPADKPLAIDPRGKLIEIRPPSGTGSPLAWGWGYFGSGAGSCSSSVDSTVLLTPGGNAPANSAFVASARFRLDNTNCSKLLRIDMGWQFPGGAPGDYTVYVGGRKVGTIHMGAVKGPAVYDVGFYNIGVRQTNEDLGNGGSGQFGPFALAARAQAGQNVDNGFLQPPVSPTERIAVNGAFKAPSLRNIELTGPYMHNGGFKSLEEVVEFYTGGAHFFHQNIADLDPEVDGIGRLKTHPERRAALVAFMKTLTDERVRNESAPFDHPELFVPNGHPGDESGVTTDLGNCNNVLMICQATEDTLHLPKVGAGGNAAPLQAFDQQLMPCVQMLVAPGTQVDEAGTSMAHVRVTLSSKPSANVTVPVVVSDATEGALPVGQLVFTPANWSTPQMLAVGGVQDGVADGNVAFQVTSGAVTSTDPRFNGIEGTRATVTTVDSGVVYQTIALEAESASLVSPMVWNSDATASGGKYVWVPNGQGNNLSSTATTGVATYNFNVTAAGSFRVWALVKTATSNDNDFWIKVDSAAYQTWSSAVTSAWAWDKLAAGSTDPLTWNLTPGAHSLKIRWREDGAKIDRIYITSNPAFVPATGHPITP